MVLIEDFVKANGGAKAIRKILIANNGIAAVKGMRSMKEWAYVTFEREEVFQFVVMATIEGISGKAEYIFEGNEIAIVPSGPSAINFGNVSLVVKIALEYNCDAVWPGWGHASENYKLALALRDAGIQWIGPSPEAMIAVGDKIGSTIIAQSCGVPCISWSGDGIVIPDSEMTDYTQFLASRAIKEACVETAEDAVQVCMKIGLPVMMKASEGGGGKGIRMIFDMESVPKAFHEVKSEVRGSPIFMMRLVERGRHLEVQIIGDNYGGCYAVGSRDCTLQRRCQKVIEEGPIKAAPDEIVAQMEACAEMLCRFVKYSNAATVEFLYRDESQEFFFLEVNARLQVEHVVTEMNANLNLPAAQLQVAMGIPLDKLADVREAYERRKNTASNRQFSRNHCIACRITADNISDGFRPTAGVVEEITLRSTPNVWGYFSVGSSGEIHQYSDSQFGHIFATGATRREAIWNMKVCLKRLTIKGEIHTNLQALKQFLEAEDFVNLNIHTFWIEERCRFNDNWCCPPINYTSGPLLDTQWNFMRLLSLAGVYRAWLHFNVIIQDFLKIVGMGHSPPDIALSTTVYLVHKQTPPVKFSMRAYLIGPNDVLMMLGSTKLRFKIYGLCNNKSDGYSSTLLITGGLDDSSRKVDFVNKAGTLRLSTDGLNITFYEDQDPRLVKSEISGRLISWLVEEGGFVQTGQAVCEVEVMKMFMSVKVNHSGKLTKVLSEGSVFKCGDIIAYLELSECEQIEEVLVYTGDFPNPELRTRNEGVLETYRGLELIMVNLLEGYCTIEGDKPEKYTQQGDFTELCRKFVNVLSRPEFLPLLLAEALDRDETVIPEPTFKIFKDVLSQQQRPINVFALQNYSELIFNDDFRRTIETELPINGIGTFSVMAHQFKDMTTRQNVWHWTNLLIRKYLEMETNRRNWNAGVSSFEAEDILKLVQTTIARQRSVELIACLLESIASICGISDDLKGLMSSTLASITGSHQDSIGHRLLVAGRCLELSRSTPRLYDRLRAVGTAIAEVLPSLTGSMFEIPRELKFDMIQDIRYMGDDALVALFTTPYYDEFFWNETNININSFARIQQLAFAIYIYRQYASLGVHQLSDCKLPTYPHRLCALWTHNSPLHEGYLCEEESNSVSETPEPGPDRRNRLSHMIRVFHAAEADDCMILPSLDTVSKKYHKSVGCVFKNPTDFMDNCFQVLGEVRDVILSSDFGSEEMEPVVLCCFIGLDNEPHTPDMLSRYDQGLPNDAPIDESWMANAMNEFKPILQRLEVQLIKIIYLINGGRSRPLEGSVLRWEPYNMSTRLRILYFGGQLNPNKPKWGIHEIDLLRFCPLNFIPFLELNRLKHFKLTAIPMLRTPNTFIFKAQPKGSHQKKLYRFFIRTVLQSIAQDDAWVGDVERTIIACLNAFENILSLEEKRGTYGPSHSGHHLLITLLTNKSEDHIDATTLRAVASTLYNTYERKLGALSIQKIEIRILKKSKANLVAVPFRVVLSNPTGQAQICRVYAERVDPTSGISIFEPVRSENNNLRPSEMDEYAYRPITTPHSLLTHDDDKRTVARKFNTVYARDFPHLFEAALEKLWTETEKLRSNNKGSKYMMNTPEKLVEAVEYHLVGKKLVALKPGEERPKCGVLCWDMRLTTPEFPQGRHIILICNDITFLRGSFGIQEDAVFLKATELAIQKGYPRVFISVNSGARMGVAQQILELYKVEWINDDNPSKGFQYLYLTKEEYEGLPEGAVATNKINHPSKGEIYKINGIIGECGIGVENLAGSGAIAGMTASAYDKIVTYTYVTGLTVGIGAYLTRLGHRVIQKTSGAPILLTGYQALNKLIGKEVYKSNEEIGGPKIMYQNGISNDIVQSDFEGVERLLRLLSYVPYTKGGPMSIVATLDPVDRSLDAIESNSTEDPRSWLRGRYILEDTDVRQGSPDGATKAKERHWIDGVFDRNSWLETMAGWAPSTIVGRARLGGIPVGVIAVETRTTETTIHADPAMPESSEQKLVRAGQVWYPDSAYKTAQAINDFGREELPLMIFANWRGFSGGQRDMSFEVLKFGSMIVEALTKYTQPVFVYIPPRCELRGGAWVVVDPRINPLFMEMYVDPSCRGGILEASGTVEIKYREPTLRATCMRLDKKFSELVKMDKQLNADGLTIDHPERTGIQDQIRIRFKDIMGSYQQVAHTFCDLHDKYYRMDRHGVINGVVPWTQVREFFYWRLRRQLIIHELRRDVRVVLESKGLLNIKFEPQQNDVEEKTTKVFEYSNHVDMMTQRVVDDWLDTHGYVEDYVNIVTLACHASNVDWVSHVNRLSNKIDEGETQLLEEPSRNRVSALISPRLGRYWNAGNENELIPK